MHDLTTQPASVHLPQTALIPTYLGEPMRPAPTHPATVELLIPTKPPLPRRLSPRRQPPAQRFAWLLIAAVAGAVIAAIWLMQARYGVDVTDVSR